MDEGRSEGKLLPNFNPLPKALTIHVLNNQRVGIVNENKPLMDELIQEVHSDYGQALKGLRPIHFTYPALANSSNHENSKNNFQEVLKVIQRNLLRCHPLIHRPAVHLRSKLCSVSLKAALR